MSDQSISDLKELSKLFPDLFNNQNGEGPRSLKLLMIEGRRRWELQKEILGLLETLHKCAARQELMINELRARSISSDLAVNAMMKGLHVLGEKVDALQQGTALLVREGTLILPEPKDPHCPLTYYDTEEDFIADMLKLREAKITIGDQVVTSQEINSFIRRNKMLSSAIDLRLKIMNRPDMIAATGFRRQSTGTGGRSFTFDIVPLEQEIAA